MVIPEIIISLFRRALATVGTKGAEKIKAVDAMMVEKDLNTVANTTGKKNMGEFPSDHPIWPDYLRTELASGTYSVDSKGNVTQDSWMP